MEDRDSPAMMFIALCRQGRAGDALRLASEADFPHLIVGLNQLADACASTPLGNLDREFILGLESFLLDQHTGQ